MCEIAEVYEVSPRKARKAHKCIECGGTIKPGEVYSYHHGVFDGQGFSAKCCPECEVLRDEFNKGKHIDDQFGLEELQDAVFESDVAIIRRFVENKARRGAVVPLHVIASAKTGQGVLF